MPRPSYLFLILLLTSQSACSSSPSPRPDELDIFATSPNAGYYAISRQVFAVGIESELRVTGELGMSRNIRAARCFDDGCSVTIAPSALDPRTTEVRVTPKVSDFVIHIDVDASGRYEAAALERRLHAVDGDIVALHRGAGPGVPFLAGMRVVWYVGLKTPNIAWDAKRVAMTVTPPFELVGPVAGEGPDQDTFLRVEIRAPESEQVENGVATLRTGALVKTFPLVSVPKSQIAKLHVAPAPDLPMRSEPDVTSPLAAIASNRIEVTRSRSKNAWLVFETRDGLFGLAGTGDCLPERGATFDVLPYAPAYYGFELDHETNPIAPGDQPILPLAGKSSGTSKLLLAVGAVSGSADVVLTEGP